MKRLLNLCCFLMLFVFQMKAEKPQDKPQFSVKVSNTSVLIGNYIEVTFTLKDAAGAQFEAPTFEGFDIVGGPNQSSSFSMINGETTQSTSYTYFLQPKDVGNYYLEPAFIQAAGETLETQPIEIIVLENPDGIIEKPKSKAPNRMELFQFPNDDFFNFPNPEELFNLPPRDDFPKDKKKGEDKDQKNKKPKKKRKVYKI